MDAISFRRIVIALCLAALVALVAWLLSKRCENDKRSRSDAIRRRPKSFQEGATRTAEARSRRSRSAARKVPWETELESVERLVQPFTWPGMLALGDAYATGVHPIYAPNERCAARCFNMCLASPDTDVVGMAAQKSAQLRETGMIDEEDRPDAPPLPPFIADDAQESAERELGGARSMDTDVPRGMDGVGIVTDVGRLRSASANGVLDRQRPPTPGPNYAQVVRHGANARDLERLFDPVHAMVQALHADGQERQIHVQLDLPVHFGFDLDAGIDELLADLPDLVDEDGEVVVDDGQGAAMGRLAGKQNVHDHSVASTTRENLRTLREKLGRSLPSRSEDARENVLQHLLDTESVSQTVKEDAYDVIVSLNDKPNTSAGDSQLGALSTVWTAIENLEDSGARQTAREALLDQLAASKENGKIVCSTGIISRIASTLDTVDDPLLSDRSVARPMWVVRQEIANLAAKTRDEFPDDPTSARKAFASRVHAEYVDRLGLASAVMEPIISEFSEHMA